MLSILKTKSTKTIIFLLFCILVLFCINTIAYSAFSSTMNITGLAHSRVEADVRITDFSIHEISNATSGYEEYSKNTVSSSVSLQANSYITYKIEVTNYGNVDMGIFSITGFPTGINYEIIDYKLQDKICDTSGKCTNLAKKTFYIKISSSSSIEIDFTLLFDFRGYHKITYTNFNNSYLSSIIDGGTTTIDLSEDSPKLVSVESTEYINYEYQNNNLILQNVISELTITAINDTVYPYSYNGSYQTFTAPYNGMYKIELWGASGGSGVLTGYSSGITNPGGGNGSYTSGTIYLSKNTPLYLYIGGAGQSATAPSQTKPGGFNGGGKGAYDNNDASGSGGGATDVRLVSGTWNNFDSLKSRIMVAGGGGGGAIVHTSTVTLYTNSMHGGGLSITEKMSSWDSYWTPNITQTTGNAFGVGQNGPTGTSHGCGGAGGGYYGGKNQLIENLGGPATGGTSFISGHNGCNAIVSSSTSSSISHTGQSIHYSGYKFSDTKMIDGLGYTWTNVKGSQTGMPTYDGTSTMTGNTGNGYAKITLLNAKEKYKIKYTNIEGTYLTEIDKHKKLVIDFSEHAPPVITVYKEGQEITDFTYQNGILTIPKVTGNIEIKKVDVVYNYSYTGSSQTFTVPYNGVYKIELWGAGGNYGLTDGSKTYKPGYGGYTSGQIEFKKNEVLYVYVGGQGGYTTNGKVGGVAGYNGGGKGGNDTNENAPGADPGGGGGGATDIRLTTTLNSRIMVAGGGGGSAFDGPGGAAGGLTGFPGNISTILGGTQTTGYAFGQGANGIDEMAGTGGGGGGYWGGSTGTTTDESGAGGSSYISGHTGCVAIASASSTSPKTGCINGTTDISCSYHYSNKIFTNTIMKNGNESMPKTDNSSTMTGNSDNGYAKITLIEVK